VAQAERRTQNTASNITNKMSTALSPYYQKPKNFIFILLAFLNNKKSPFLHVRRKGLETIFKV
jgi:hypothetical protein